MANKRALIVGINAYPTAPLRGCVNDAMMVSELLTKHFGFKANEKRMLTDESATTSNILSRLNWLVDGAKPGDILHFHFSGHGSQMINQNYETDFEPDELDEIICPVDLDWREKVIRDDDLKRIFDKVPAGVHLTVVLDCCNSGSGLDQVNQYQPTTTRAHEFGPDSPNRNRLLPMPADIANRGLGLDLKPRARSVQSRQVDKTGLMVSGCQAHQTSADAFIDNQYCGAATYAFIQTLEMYDYNIPYKVLVEEMNNFMVERNFSQRPELNGNPALYDTKVLDGHKMVPADSVAQPITPPPVDYVVDDTPPKPEKDDDDKKDKSKILIIVGVIVAIIAAVASQSL